MFDNNSNKKQGREKGAETTIPASAAAMRTLNLLQQIADTLSDILCILMVMKSSASSNKETAAG
jgi:hypothetical protein